MFLDSISRRLGRLSWVKFQMRMIIQVFYLATSFKKARLVPGVSGSASWAIWMKMVELGPDAEPFFKILDWYQRISTVYMVYALSCEVLPLEWTLKSVLGVPGPGHCYLPGRFMLVEPMGRFVTLAMSSSHVAWRLVQHFSTRRRHVQLSIFLLHEVESIDQTQLQVQARNYYCAKRKLRRPLRPEETLKKPLVPVMYTQIEERRMGTWWRLRASRSVSQRKRIGLFSARYMMVVLLCIAIVVSFFTPLCLYMLLVAANHHSLYPGCREAGWSDHYRLLWFPFDLMENVFLHVDTVIAIFCALPLGAILNSDLLQQWAQLDAQMRSLRIEMLESRLVGRNPEELERHVVECQARLHDFFQQVMIVDEFMSDFLTTVTVLLVIVYLMMDYYFARLQAANELYIMLATLLFVFAVFTFYSFICLTVHRATAGSYALMCTLMALDQGRFKMRFTTVLDFYLASNRCAYSLFRGQYAYLPSTYLTVIGWTLSCATIINTMFKSHSSKVALYEY